MAEQGVNKGSFRHRSDTTYPVREVSPDVAKEQARRLVNEGEPDASR
jgi:hypothetical protein